MNSSTAKGLRIMAVALTTSVENRISRGQGYIHLDKSQIFVRMTSTSSAHHENMNKIRMNTHGFMTYMTTVSLLTLTFPKYGKLPHALAWA